MRHRAPLAPAVHLGADRILVIGVRDERPDPEPPSDGEPRMVSPLGTLAGIAV